jgi:hypothetical protein
VVDVDFEDMAICPVQQAGGVELKTAMSRTPVPISAELADELAASIEKFGGEYVVTDGVRGRSSTWAIERAVRAAKRRLPDLPDGFRSTIFGATSRRC